MTAMKRSTQKSSMELNNSSLNCARDFQTGRETDRFLHMHAKSKVFDEFEMYQKSSPSLEDMESPRSVFSKVRKWLVKNFFVRVYSLILKIKEEDSHLGEDVFREYCLSSACGDKVAGHEDVAVVIFFRPALPASPLNGKTTFN